MEPRGARGHRQRDVRPDRDQLHRRQFAVPVAGQARVDRSALSGTPRGLHRPHAGLRGLGGAGGGVAAARARQARALRISQGDRVHGQPADDHHRKSATAGAAAARGREKERKSMNADLIGVLAGTLSTIAFIPQAWRIWKTRSARDLSLPMYLIFTAGVALWFVYGLMLGAVPIVVCNGLTLVLAGTVLAMKLRFG